jgi:hypothetical protein
MRFNEFKPIINEAGLTAGELFNPKYNRPEVLMKMIAAGKPLTLKDGKPVVIDNSPENLKAYQQALDNKQLPVLLSKDTKQKVSMGNVLKTVDFGGHGVPTGQDASQIINKTTMNLKPANIEIVNKLFNLSTLASAVINNKVLKSTPQGEIVINMAKEIMATQVPTYDAKATPKNMVAAIQDDAGEYLGVMGLLNNTALNFPTMSEFMEHLKVTDISKLTVSFPEQINFPLGDSFAIEGVVENQETGNKIFISSKGRTGAAPSLQGLEIPKDLLDKKEYAKEVKFVQLIQSTTKEQGWAADYQPLRAINFIKQNCKPGVIPKWLDKYLPFTPEQMKEIMKWKDNKKYQISNVNDYASQIPDWLQLILGEIPPNERVAPHASPGGWLLYKITTALKEAVNENNALPNFQPIAREILQRNFIQINATAQGGQMTFKVMWPNREMGTGTITIETKNTAATTGSSLGFRVK